MQTYRYHAVSPSGEKISGTVEAYDEFEAVNRIREQNSIVLKIEAVPERKKAWMETLNEPLTVSEKALSLLASQFEILLRAGITFERATQIVRDQTTDRYLKKVFTNVADDVAAGYSMSSSIERHGKKLPVTFIETVRAGEESGSVEKSFEKLKIYYEKSYKLHAKLKAALTYPVFLITLAVIVVMIVVNFTVPVVSQIIVEAGGDLPLPTKILMGMYDFFGKWWPLILAVAVGLIIAWKMYGKTENGRLKLSGLALRLPVIGNINLMNCASQFANTMATLIASGLSVTRALSSTGKVMDNYACGSSVCKAVAGIEEGKSLGLVIKDNPYLPPLLKEMTAVGEESGSLDDTLSTIGLYFDGEVEQASNKALGMLEPMITIFLGLAIGFIVLALYMPMFTMYNSI